MNQYLADYKEQNSRLEDAANAALVQINSEK
jgi:hypothetical protein